MKPINGLSFQLYSARTVEPLEAQFELLAGLGYKKVEPFGGLFGDPQKLKSQLERHGMSAPRRSSRAAPNGTACRRRQRMSASTGCAPIRLQQAACAVTSASRQSTPPRRPLASATAARPSGLQWGVNSIALARSSPPRA